MPTINIQNHFLCIVLYKILKATYTVVYKESTLVYDILFIYILYAKPWGKITLMT